MRRRGGTHILPLWRQKKAAAAYREEFFLCHSSPKIDGYLSGRTLEEALVLYGLEYLQFLKKHIDYLTLIWSPEMIQDEAVSEEVFRLIGSIESAGGSMLKQGMEKEPLAEGTYEVAMSMLTSSIFLYYMIHSRFGKNSFTYDEESYVRKLVQLLLHGLHGQSH